MIMVVKSIHFIPAQVMKEGDIVLGEVVSKRPFGIFVKLTALEFSKTRDFTDTNLEVGTLYFYHLSKMLLGVY